MDVKAPRGIARFDSAAALARALGLALAGKPVDSLSGSPLLDRLMPAINLLPRRGREWVYAVGGMTEAIAKRDAHRLAPEAIAAWLAGQFPARPYTGAFIGSSNGAMVHLAAALGMPWLPQTFLCPVRQFGIDPGDGKAGLAAGMPVVQAMLESQPGLVVHHMQDPNQDRLMLQTMSYFRPKFGALPEAYRRFLTRRLAPGATLYVVACTQSWRVTRTSARSVFQFGALGGATMEEYFNGGERVAAHLRRYHDPRTRWDPPPPDAEAPEAEWGFEESLLPELEALAREQGWRLVEIRFGDPETLSFAAGAAYRSWYAAHGIRPTRLIVDNFVLMDPMRTIGLHAIPFWLVFNTEPSARSLARFLEQSPGFDEIHAMLFSNGMEGVGLVPIERWRQLVGRARLQGGFLGVDERRYPRDFATFIRFRDALARLGPQGEAPPPLSADRFESVLAKEGASLGITLSARDAARRSRTG